MQTPANNVHLRHTIGVEFQVPRAPAFSVPVFDSGKAAEKRRRPIQSPRRIVHLQMPGWLCYVAACVLACAVPKLRRQWLG